MSPRTPTGALVAGLGAAQLVAWSTLYYSIAVLAEPMGRELTASRGQIFGAFTWALVISGLLARWVGRRLDRHGGRAVLVASTFAGALAFIGLAHARSLTELLGAWSIAGLAMALGLYDMCFASIGQAYPSNYRVIMTGVTLVAGFASTISWPLSHYLAESVGWRGACQVYAVGLLACAPLYVAALPRVRVTPQVEPCAPPAPRAIDARERRRSRLLALSFAGTALIGGALSAHLIGILNELSLAGDRAVWISSSIGALQVLGRVGEMLVGSKHSVTRLGMLTFGAYALAMGLLAGVAALPVLVLGFALLYGVANGLLTIVKARLPVDLFGFANVGALLGAFGAPSLVARALSPAGFAIVTSASSTQAALLGLLAVGLASFAAYEVAIR